MKGDDKMWCFCERVGELDPFPFLGEGLDKRCGFSVWFEGIVRFQTQGKGECFRLDKPNQTLDDTKYSTRSTC